MRHGRRSKVLGALAVIVWLAMTSTAGAVEYRLRVVSIPDVAYMSNLLPGEYNDGAAGAGLNRLETTLDRGEFPKGPVLFDRRVQPVRDSIGRAYGGVRVLPTVTWGGADAIVWDEMVWEGNPGEHSVWILSPTIIGYFQEVYNVALRGTGPLRNYQPFALPMDGSRVTALTIPLNFLWAQEERGTAWAKYISRGLDLRTGIGLVVGVNTNQQFPDVAYIITQHTEEPTTYEAVVVWRQRRFDRQAPGQGTIIIR
ncbi:MAG TPA: hypothetical protein VMS64_40820 [Candidatus Methylomirabilis sp.]|nr:hypothetical protein [Candidatus Methylomirabilis sp.]